VEQDEVGEMDEVDEMDEVEVDEEDGVDEDESDDNSECRTCLNFSSQCHVAICHMTHAFHVVSVPRYCLYIVSHYSRLLVYV
jgi:hypothetical protein